jgi:aldose 1-epimerase
MTDLEGFDAVTLAAGDLVATFVPAANVVCASLRHRDEELLGQRRGLRAYAERNKTMGIPFLHPWANRVAADTFTVAGREVHAEGLGHEEHGLPIHGVPPQPYEVVEAGDATLRARVRFEHDAFPFPHDVEQEVTLRPDALRIATTVSGGPLPIAFGFHPYLRLPGVPRADWVVALPARTRLLTDDRALPTGEVVAEEADERPLGDRTFDDGYADVAGAAFAVHGGGRRLELAFLEGYAHGQVFAPPNDDVVCFEPMTAPANALVSGDGLRVLGAGEAFRAAFEIRVG